MFGGGAALDGRSSLGTAIGAGSLGAQPPDGEDESSTDGSDASDAPDDSADDTSDSGELLPTLLHGHTLMALDMEALPRASSARSWKASSISVCGQARQPFGVERLQPSLLYVEHHQVFPP